MASPSRLPALLLGLVLGAAGGFAVTHHFFNKAQEPAHEVFYSNEPEIMLFPAGFTVEEGVDTPELYQAMVNPDAIRIHPASESGSLVVEGWKFSPEGATPDQETTDRLKWALGSVSSYEPPGKVCRFHADVLLRLEKDGRTHDIIFCFSCSETTAGLDMSIEGKRTFLKCFCDGLPGYTSLHEARKTFEERY